MNLTLDIPGVTDSEESVRRCHFGLAMKLSAVGAQQLVAVYTLHRGRSLLSLPPRVFLDDATSIFVPDDAGGPADLATTSTGLGSGSWRTSTPDDVGQLGDQKVVGESRDAAGWNGRSAAAARARQVAVV